jgi:hypothetical protein
MVVNLREKLKETFSFRRFRPGQAQAVQAALDGRDMIVIMPTGSGKSLCFQLPGFQLKGMTLGVGPLIALMKDQVDQLHRKGIRAILVNSSLSASELRERSLRSLPVPQISSIQHQNVSRCQKMQDCTTRAEAIALTAIISTRSYREDCCEARGDGLESNSRALRETSKSSSPPQLTKTPRG